MSYYFGNIISLPELDFTDDTEHLPIVTGVLELPDLLPAEIFKRVKYNMLNRGLTLWSFSMEDY